MKVLVVTEPGVDGVFRYVESLCDFLMDGEMSVHLAYSDRRGSDRLPMLVSRIEARGGSTLNLRTANRPEPADWQAFLALRRMASAVKPDVIHSHSSKAGALARALVFCGVRAVQVYQPHAYVGMRPVRGRLDFLYDAVERVLGRTAHTLTCSSAERSFALQHLGLSPRRVHTVRHGVDTRVFAPPAPDEKRRMRESLGLPWPAPILGFLGRSSAQKDPLTLYRAFARAAAVIPDIALFHVGHGELDDELKRLARDLRIGNRVFRCPYMATPADFYRMVDGFILTSRYEGFSLAALEALAADLPMILSAAPGNLDLLAQPLSHAWKASPGDVGGFACGISRWAEALRHPSPSTHRQIAQTNYQPSRQLEAVLDLYRVWLRSRRLSESGNSEFRTCSPQR